MLSSGVWDSKAGNALSILEFIHSQSVPPFSSFFMPFRDWASCCSRAPLLAKDQGQANADRRVYDLMFYPSQGTLQPP